MGRYTILPQEPAQAMGTTVLFENCMGTLEQRFKCEASRFSTPFFWVLNIAFTCNEDNLILGHRNNTLANGSVILFSSSNRLFLEYFTQKMLFLIIKVIDFRGDLTDISAETTTLHRTL